ncbi:hypothetical protein MHZ93_00755 [Roseomonas sp. ACRSG]|nr:hypothetical protein [Roseomonas sp. ACRSG]
MNDLSISQFLYRDLPKPASLGWKAPLAVVPTNHVPAKAMAELMAWTEQRQRDKPARWR